MVQTKKDLHDYIEADFKKLGYRYTSVLPAFGKETLKFQKAMRCLEYYSNSKGKLKFFMRCFWKYRYHKLSIKLGFDIPINTFDKGLNIHHYGNVVVNGKARIGKNCSIQQGVVIGFAGNDSVEAPIIGDNCSIGAGAKILGGIKVPNNTIIGANAVVVKSYETEGITLVGVPSIPGTEHKFGGGNKLVVFLYLQMEHWKNSLDIVGKVRIYMLISCPIINRPTLFLI